jgi:outer membrane protein assembly factor BamB
MSNRSASSFLNSLCRRRGVLSALAALLLIGVVGAISGCGGGSHGSSTQSATRAGHVQLQVQWPAYQSTRAVNGRYIPAYAQSLFLDLYPTATAATHYQMSANRPDDKPSTQTIAFDQLIPAGNYTLAVVARIEKDGQGATVASAATTFVVQAGQTFDASLTLATTLKTLSIQGQPLSVAAGSVLSLVGQALDPDGNIVLLPVGALTWKLVSGSSIATLTSDGAFTALAPGTARVRLSEDLAGVASEADVTITGAVANAGGLANSSWPKAGGDAANTGRSKASGATGSKGWTYGGVSVSHVVFFTGGVSFGADGTLYVGSTPFGDPTGTPELLALDSATGIEKWHVPVSRQAEQPTVSADGTVLIGDSTGKVSAFDGQSGAAKWSFQTAGGASFPPSMNIGPDGTVYVNAGIAYALDGKTGAQKWKADPGAGYINSSGLSSPPAIGLLNTVYFGGSDPLYAVDGLTGVILWKVSSPNSIAGTFTTPAVGSDGTVYCLHTGTPSVLYAFDGRTGTKKWQFIVQSDLDVGKGSPAIGTDGTIYVVGRDQLFALDPATGSKKWASSGIFNGQSPVIGGDGAIYLYETAFWAFNPADGSVKFSVQDRSQDASGAHGLSIGPNGSLYGVSTYSIYQMK